MTVRETFQPMIASVFTRLLLALLLVAGLWTGPAFAREIELLAGKWPPYVDERLPGGGLALAIVREAFRRGGHSVRFSIRPWSRGLRGARLGVFEGLAAAWRSSARENELAYSKPYLTNEIRIVTRADRPLTVRSVEDLRGLRLGVVRDYAYGEPFDSADFLDRVSSNALLENLLRVLNGQIDATLDDTRVLQWEIDHRLGPGKQRLKLLDPPLARRGLYVALSRQLPDYQRLLADFNRGLDAMKQDGTYRNLLERYDAY